MALAGSNRPARGQRDGVCLRQDRRDAHRVGQRPGQRVERRPHRGHPLRRAEKGQRLFPVLAAQRLQQTRQAEDVVAMVVGQADGVQLHQVDTDQILLDRGMSKLRSRFFCSCIRG